MVMPIKAERSQALPADPGQWEESDSPLNKPHGGQLPLVTLTSCLLKSRSKLCLHPSPSSTTSDCAEQADRRTQTEKKELQGKRLLCFRMVITCSAPRIDHESWVPSARAGGYVLRGERSRSQIPMTHSRHIGWKSHLTTVWTSLDSMCKPTCQQQQHHVVWMSHSFLPQ